MIHWTILAGAVVLAFAAGFGVCLFLAHLSALVQGLIDRMTAATMEALEQDGCKLDK